MSTRLLLAMFTLTGSQILMTGTVQAERGESLFLRKLVLGIPAQSSGKNYATTDASGGPDSSASPRFDPTRGRNIGSRMT